MASMRIFGHVLCKRHLFVCSNNTAVNQLLYAFNNTPCAKQKVQYCSKRSVTKVDSPEAEGKAQVAIGEVVKENTKSAFSLAVILAGLGVTGFIFYIIVRELFSSNTPTGIYTKALNRCLQDTRVLDALGEPIKAYGEQSRRGRRQHVSHMYYMKEGVKYMRMKFHIKGSRRHASVLLEVKENESGDYSDYTYLFVLVDDLVKTAIQLEDNRTAKENYFFNADTASA